MYSSPLEQFLLLEDEASFVVNIILGAPIMKNFHDLTVWCTIRDFAEMFRYGIFLKCHSKICYTLVNIQYYKLSLFLIILCSPFHVIKHLFIQKLFGNM